MKLKIYRNEGPPWRRQSGEVVPQGGTFVASLLEQSRISRRHQERRFIEVGEAPLPQKGPAREQAQTTVAVVDEQGAPWKPELAEQPESSGTSRRGEWKLRMDPAQYLRLHPTGPNAELAKALVEEVLNVFS